MTKANRIYLTDPRQVRLAQIWWDEAYNTFEIAKFLGASEVAVLNTLHRRRELRNHISIKGRKA